MSTPTLSRRPSFSDSGTATGLRALDYIRIGAYNLGMPRATTTPRAERASSEAVLSAFAEPTRLRLLALVEGGETCVCDLVETLGLPQPTVSRHLAVLRRAGLVRARREGLWMWYSLAPASGRLHQKLLECLACCRAEVSGLAAQAKCCTTLRTGRGRC
jgi:ArsR family transcriptional regulator